MTGPLVRCAVVGEHRRAVSGTRQVLPRCPASGRPGSNRGRGHTRHLHAVVVGDLRAAAPGGDWRDSPALGLLGTAGTTGAVGANGAGGAAGALVPHLAILWPGRSHFGSASAWLLLVRPAAPGNAPDAVCRVAITSHLARDLVGPRPQFARVPRPRRPSRTPHRPRASSLIATAVGVAVDGSYSERRWVRGLKAVRACAQPSKE